MSRPFSSDYADARTLPVEPILDLYASSVSYYHDGKRIHHAGFVCAVDKEHARIQAMAQIKHLYPECQGYLSHDVDLQKIPDNTLSAIGYHR